MKSTIPCGPPEPFFSQWPPPRGIHLQRERVPSSQNDMLPRLLASSLSCCSNCHSCLRNSKITLPVLYFNSEIDASVRQFVFLGKCKELCGGMETCSV